MIQGSVVEWKTTWNWNVRFKGLMHNIVIQQQMD